MSVEQLVREHFNADARRFDAIYNDEKGFVSRWIDNVWRGVVRRRLELTLRLLEPIAGKTILDVGCGSGRYCLAYGRRGAAKVLGVDLATEMIAVAQEMAERERLRRQCEFRAGCFPDVVPEGEFDAATALGLFDYVVEPAPILREMKARARQALVISFPKSWEWRVPFRRLRFWLNQCPLFLYSEKQVRSLLADAGLTNYEWIVLDRDYLVVAHLE